MRPRGRQRPPALVRTFLAPARSLSRRTPSPLSLRRRETTMKPFSERLTSTRIGLAMSLVLVGGAACDNQPGATASDESLATPSTAPELDPTTVPRFQTNFQRFYSYAPTRNGAGQNEVTVQINTFQAQQLPSGFPSTPLFGYGGDVFVRYDANGQPVPAIEQTGPVHSAHLPRPKFEQTAPGPRPDPLPQRAGRRPPRPRRPDARLGEPQQLPQADPAVLAVPAGVPAGAVADRAHHAHARHRGAARVRRHA